MCNCPVVLKKHHLLQILQIPWLLQPYHPLFPENLSLGSSETYIQFQDEHSTVSYSPHVDQLGGLCIGCHILQGEVFLIRFMRCTVLWVQSLQNSFSTVPRQQNNRFSPRAHNLLSHRFLDSLIVPGASLRSNPKVIDYSHNINATIVPAGIAYQASYSCSSQILQLCEIDHYFSPLIVCIVPSCTVKAMKEGASGKRPAGFCFLFIIYVYIIHINYTLQFKYIVY